MNTLVLGLIGEGISESLSPQLHSAIAAQRSSRLSYALIDNPSFADALKRAEELGLRGVNVTAPHKGAAAASAFQRSREVELLGVANTLTRESGGWRAENSDLPALERCLPALLPEANALSDDVSPPVVLFGSGATARTTLLALNRLNDTFQIPPVRLYERGGASTVRLSAWLKSCPLSFPLERRRWGEWGGLSAARLIISALPPLSSTEWARVPRGELLPHGHLFDLNYGARVAGSAAYASSINWSHEGGLKMLIWQGIYSALWWSGFEANFEEIWEHLGS